MYNFPIFLQPHFNNLIALFLTSHNYRIFLTENVVTAIDKHTEFKISFILIGNVEVYNFISEGVRNLFKAGLVERQGGTHHDAFRAVSDVDFEGDDVRAEREKLIRVRSIQHEIILGTLWQFGVFGRNISINIKGVVDIIQRLGVSPDRNVNNFNCRINQHLHSAVPWEYYLIGIIHLLVFVVGRVGNGQGDHGVDIAIEFPDNNDQFCIVNNDYFLLVGHLSKVDGIEIILILLYLVDEECERRQRGCHFILILQLQYVLYYCEIVISWGVKDGDQKIVVVVGFGDEDQIATCL